MRKISIAVLLCLASHMNTSLSFAQGGEDPFAISFGSITPREEVTIERTTLFIWRHIAQARSDIHHKAIPDARRELVEAERLMATVSGDLSTAIAKERIRIAGKHLEYETSEQVVRELPGIESALERIAVYYPTEMARRHIALAKGYL